MPQFKTLKLSNRRNNEAVMQCSAYGKLTVNLISKDDRQQNISFKAIIYQGDKVIHSSSFFSMKLELPRLNIGQYKLERSEEHTSELQSRENLVCRLLLEK